LRFAINKFSYTWPFRKSWKVNTLRGSCMFHSWTPWLLWASCPLLESVAALRPYGIPSCVPWLVLVQEGKMEWIGSILLCSLNWAKNVDSLYTETKAERLCWGSGIELAIRPVLRLTNLLRSHAVSLVQTKTLQHSRPTHIILAWHSRTSGCVRMTSALNRDSRRCSQTCDWMAPKPSYPLYASSDTSSALCFCCKFRLPRSLHVDSRFPEPSCINITNALSRTSALSLLAKTRICPRLP
jgi:hypothetical protein